MLRFLPDTLRDALWRPIAMAAPNAGVYVEIMAPDLRFAMLLLLTLAGAFYAVKRRGAISAGWPLLAFVWLAFIPWLATTGNGRYFIPVLIVVGPACIALIHRMPLTTGFRLSAAAIVVALQAFALVQNNPWGLWRLAPWSQPYFPVKLTQDELSRPATYVTVSGISYSLIALQFDPRSRWISVASLPGNPEHNLDDRRAHAFLQQAAPLGQPILGIFPSLPAYMLPNLQPNPDIRSEIDRLLAPHQLALEPARPCRMIESRGIASVAVRNFETRSPETLAKFGFWICPLAFPVVPPPAPKATPETEASRLAFAKLEQQCPRLFPPAETASVRVANGFYRAYPSADMKAYVLDDGDVFYKYWRALNPTKVGTVESVLADSFRMDCNAVAGRSGLPWERKL